MKWIAATARLFFVLIVVMACATIGMKTTNVKEYTVIGFTVALLMVLIEQFTQVASSKKILFAATGLTMGLMFSTLLMQAVPANAFQEALPQGAIHLISHMFFAYLGIALAMRHVDRFSFSRLNFILAPTMEAEKLLDTSMLIDGRILDVAQTNFLPGPFVVPQFVVTEMQTLADSSDSIKRERGLRGLACLEDMLNANIRIRLDDQADFPGANVDQKLVAMARVTNALLMTVDFGLQKVAQINQVRTMNLNELANLLKPTTYVGDMLRVHIARRGKEHGQGVGFLDDGTMVVVDGGAEFIGTEVGAEVTSVLQNATGRMVFTRCMGEAPHPTPPLGQPALERQPKGGDANGNGHAPRLPAPASAGKADDDPDTESLRSASELESTVPRRPQGQQRRADGPPPSSRRRRHPPRPSQHS